MPTYTEADRYRAHVEHDAWAESQTDEQRAHIAKVRQILGGLDETAALNRAEAS